MLAYFKSEIEDFEQRSELAFTHMARWRAPLYHVDPSLFDDILDKIEEYCEEYGGDPSRYDPEDFMWMEQ